MQVIFIQRKGLKMLNMTFSNSYNLFKSYRMGFGYSQKQVSDMLGVNQHTYSRYENNKIRIPNVVFDRFLDLYKIELYFR